MPQKVSSWTKKFKNMDSKYLWLLHTPKKLIQSHLLRPRSRSGPRRPDPDPDPTKKVWIRPDPQHCAKQRLYECLRRHKRQKWRHQPRGGKAALLRQGRPWWPRKRWSSAATTEITYCHRVKHLSEAAMCQQCWAKIFCKSL
jgi:hypothetical protein